MLDFLRERGKGQFSPINSSIEVFIYPKTSFHSNLCQKSEASINNVSTFSYSETFLFWVVKAEYAMKNSITINLILSSSQSIFFPHIQVLSLSLSLSLSLIYIYSLFWWIFISLLNLYFMSINFCVKIYLGLMWFGWVLICYLFFFYY